MLHTVVSIFLRNNSKILFSYLDRFLASNPNRNTAKLEHRCEECKLNFPRRKERIEHLRNVHKELGCNFCDKKFKLESFLLKHVSVHGESACPSIVSVHLVPKNEIIWNPHSQVPMESYCSNVYAVNCTLPASKSGPSTSAPITLTNWNAKYAGRWRTIPIHSISTWNTRINRKLIKCAWNAVSFVRKTKTKSLKSLSAAVFEFSAGKLFQNSILLKRHEDNDCGKNEIYKCEHCGKHLGSPYSLRSHVENMHENQEKKFVCSFCGKAFFSKGALQSHSRNHTGERPYKCDHCDKSFASRTSARNHESTHTGIKPYMCQCGDRFSCISNLQSHRKARKTTCGLLPLISKRLPDTRIVDTHLKKSGEENPKSTKRV